MKQKQTVKLQFGRKRSVKETADSAERTANQTLILGLLTVGVFFFGTLTGTSLRKDAEQIESVYRDHAVPVMGYITETAEEEEGQSEASVKEFIRKSIRDTAAEPFGYMNGKWNLWEYLGDVMADLLLGG